MRIRAQKIRVGDPNLFNEQAITATAGFGSAQRKATNACCRN